jgi:protocatechuate 3,4-dioxygenase beta subunit
MSDDLNSNRGEPADRPSDGTQFRRRDLMVLSAGALASAALYACGADEGGTGTSVAAGAKAKPDCVLTPEQLEGPFYIDLARVRRNIVEDRPGVPLALAVNVVDASTCEPIGDAAVDIWHCDALGAYSGATSEGSQTYLRGIQLTDRNGLAEFATIYPGQYPGRATHIHLKVHTGGRQSDATYSGGHIAHTGQLFTTDQRDAEVFVLGPYNQNTAAITPRDLDGIFQTQGGSSAVLALARAGDIARDGLAARTTLGVDRRNAQSSAAA